MPPKKIVGKPASKISRPPQRQQTDDDYSQPTEDPRSYVFQIIKEAKQYSTLEPGKYEAILYDLELQQANAAGISIRATFVIARPDLLGRKHFVFFRMMGSDWKTPDEWGPVFLKRMLGKLGYDPEEVNDEMLTEISEQQPGVVLRVTAGKQAGFVNAQVDGTLDDDNENIVACREWLEANPF